MKLPSLGSIFRRQLSAGPVCLLLGICVALACPGFGAVRLDLRYGGVYRVSGHELAAAGVPLGAVLPGQLRLTCGGETVPLLVTGGDDNSLDPSDTIEFIATAARSALLGDDAPTTAVWFMPENKSNVYFLTWDAPAPGAQYTLQPAPPAADTDSAPPQRFWQWRHYETNYLHTFSTLPPDQTDNFTWMEFRAGMKPEDITRTNLDLAGFDPTAGQPVQLALHMVGLTAAARLSPSHKFQFLYDMKPVGQVAFNGIALHTASITIPADAVRSQPARISFDTPDDRTTAVDSIQLDWIQARYPSRLDAGGAELYQFNNNLLQPESATDAASATTDTLIVAGLPSGAAIFDPTSRRAWQLAPDQQTAAITNNTRPTTYTAAAPYARMSVDQISRLTTATALPTIDPRLQALIVYHPRLSQTAQALAAYRRQQDWNIQAVSVRAIFDQLNHGFISDAALKAYIRSVRQAAPGLTHLVLLGDSYFDYREARSYDDPRQYDVLIPIHWVYRPGVKWSGGYQDDNWYGSFENEYRPDIAVGRIPVNTDRQGMEYLRKIIAHEVLRQGAADKGLLVSSVEQNFQSLVNEVSQAWQDQFSTVTTLFPRASTANAEVANLQQAIDTGVQLMYYVGHGGSLVWRVGPTDFSRQKDLFTPKDVKQLTNRNHYPLIVCASCYTTAFDQPESIGEALVNQPAGGAIAVVGASWKATVQDSHQFNRHLFEFYFDPAVKTMGQASLLAHREYIPPGQQHALYSSFTFLGDPCTAIIRKGDPAAPVATTSTVYSIQDDQVRLTDYDNQPAPEDNSQVAAQWGIQDFGDAKVYRDRVLLSRDKMISNPVEIPADATTISLTGRSRPAGWIFPRLRVSLITEDNNRHRIYEGYWASLGMQTQQLPVPEYVRNHKARLQIEMLNEGTVDEERTFYFLEIRITSPAIPQ